MYNKKSGFTLIELIIAIALLSFVIIMSGTMFDVAIFQSVSHKNSIVNEASILSKFDENILLAKQYASYYVDSTYGASEIREKPKGYDLNSPVDINETFDFNGKRVNKIKGYFISAIRDSSSKDNLKLSFNDVSDRDILTSFVGLGHTLSPTSNVENMYVNKNKSFIFYPFDVSDNVDFGYSINDYNSTFSAIRTNNMISRVYNDTILFASPHSSNLSYSNYENMEEATEMKYLSSSNVKLVNAMSFNSNSKEHIKYMDRSFIASGFTLNKNARISTVVSSLDNSDDGKSKFVYLVGLPYNKNLAGFFDYNLAISKGNDHNYYSLFDIYNKDKTTFSSNFTEETDKYRFDWGVDDVRKMLDLDGNQTVSNIKMSNSFTNKQNITLDDGSKKIVPYNVEKAYGNTMYFKDDIATITPSGNHTLFLKFNSQNYNNMLNNKTSIQPMVLLSNNIDLKTGNIKNTYVGNGGFIVYIDTDNKIKYVIWEYELKSGTISPKIISKNDNLYDLNNTNLYKDNARASKSLFDPNFKNNGRDNFNIFAVTISKSGTNYSIKLNILERDISKSDKLENKIKTIDIPIASNVYENEIILGGRLTNPINEMGIYTPIGEDDSAIEVSDVLMYNQDLSSISQGSKNMLNCIMDYLYRKYLTDVERENFDEYFINNY